MKKVILASLTVFLIGQAICLPWIIRNYKIWGAYVPYTAANYYLYQGWNPTIKNGWEISSIPSEGKYFIPELQKAMDEYNVKTFQKLALLEIIKFPLFHPIHALRIALERAYAFMVKKKGCDVVWPIALIEESKFNHRERLLNPKTNETLKNLAFGAYKLLLATFIWALAWTCWKRAKIHKKEAYSIVLILLCIGFYVLEQMIIYPDHKYRYPIEVLMMVFASYGVLKIIELKTAPKFVDTPQQPIKTICECCQKEIIYIGKYELPICAICMEENRK